MRKLLVLLLVVSFILWILPLGVFIKASLQKLACDGQRAICMCHVNFKTMDKSMEAVIALKAGTSSSKENSSGSSGNYFVSAKPVIILKLNAISFFENQQLFYTNPSLTALEYVPKI